MLKPFVSPDEFIRGGHGKRLMDSDADFAIHYAVEGGGNASKVLAPPATPRQKIMKADI